MGKTLFEETDKSVRYQKHSFFTNAFVTVISYIQSNYKKACQDPATPQPATQKKTKCYQLFDLPCLIARLKSRAAIDASAPPKLCPQKTRALRGVGEAGDDPSVAGCEGSERMMSDSIANKRMRTYTYVEHKSMTNAANGNERGPLYLCKILIFYRFLKMFTKDSSDK